MAVLDRSEAKLILDAFSTLTAELEAISKAGDRLKNSRSPEVEEWRARMVAVKAKLKAAAKTETLDGSRKPKTELEQFFYGPAVRQAAANFLMSTAAPPSKWMAELYSSTGDISYMAHGLQKQLDDSDR